jgi:hypothetical protein
MTPAEVRQRLASVIDWRATDDQYIDRDEEREILQFAVQMGYGLDDARTELAAVCVERGYVLESAVLRVIREQIEAAVRNDGKIDRAEFERAFAAARAAVRGKKSDADIKRMLVTMMEDTGNTRVRRGWFTNWYTALKKELGMG